MSCHLFNVKNVGVIPEHGIILFPDVEEAICEAKQNLQKLSCTTNKYFGTVAPIEYQQR